MDLSQITDNLYIGTTPDVEDYPFLRELGIKLVINMRFERPPKRDPHPMPLRTLWLPTFDNPLLPIPMCTLRRGIPPALETMAQGGRVLVHCAAGVHRSVAMGAAIMIAQGQSAENSMALIKARRQIADPDIWYIRRRIERFAQMWESDHAS